MKFNVWNIVLWHFGDKCHLVVENDKILLRKLLILERLGILLLLIVQFPKNGFEGNTMECIGNYVIFCMETLFVIFAS